MMLVDTSVWVDHFRLSNPAVVAALNADAVLAHPAVIGELALGSLKRRSDVLRFLHHLPSATIATDAETLGLIEQRKLAGSGVGYVDAGLLAAVLLTPGATLWTKDSRLHTVAHTFGIATP